MLEKRPTQDELLVQRYYDGELDEAQVKEAESLLEENTALRKRLGEYRNLSSLVQLSTPADSDELAKHRDWEAVVSGIERSGSRRGRKFSYWIGAAAAAALAIIFYSPFGASASNELIIESVSSTYDSFMLIQPLSDDEHTIIWINDPSSAVD
jgi:anti-sigma factor RsiW